MKYCKVEAQHVYLTVLAAAPSEAMAPISCSLILLRRW